ncbi:MAG: hypothetical protein E7L30_10570 [Lactococcus lactis]|nr:hypothetical protein [Lactococcus lactis]
MKQNLSREEAKKSLVYDPYFEKGNYGSKIFQTLVAILSWFYSVKEEQNLETDFVKKLYQEGEKND